MAASMATSLAASFGGLLLEQPATRASAAIQRTIRWYRASVFRVMAWRIGPRRLAHRRPWRRSRGPTAPRQGVRVLGLGFGLAGWHIVGLAAIQLSDRTASARLSL